MALVFPSSPTNGQVFTDTGTGNRYVYDASNGVWKYSSNNVGVTVGTAPPPINQVAPGAMWYNTNTGRTFIFYDDGDSKQWVENIPAPGNFDSSTVAGYANAATILAVAPAFNKANSALANTTGTFAGSLTTTGDVTSGGTLQALTTVQSSSGADLNLNANGANRDVIMKVNGTELARLVGSTGNLNVINTINGNTAIYAVEALVVGAGGGAGSDVAGGGGGGGVLCVTSHVQKGNSYGVVVGAGGAGAISNAYVGTRGGASSFNSAYAWGGGGGGSYSGTNAVWGASGGGGGGGAGSAWGWGGFSVPNQGGSGAAGYAGGFSGAYGCGGGGGGAGMNYYIGRSYYHGGDGGYYPEWAAATSTGANTGYYAGGGAGQDDVGTGGGVGGVGGGATTGNGTVNTGGGGGGTAATGGQGGSGIVIIRYQGPRRATGGTIYTSAGYTYHVFTSSSTFVA